MTTRFNELNQLALKEYKGELARLESWTMEELLEEFALAQNMLKKETSWAQAVQALILQREELGQ